MTAPGLIALLLLINAGNAFASSEEKVFLFTSYWGPSSLYHRDDLVDWPRAMGV